MFRRQASACQRRTPGTPQVRPALLTLVLVFGGKRTSGSTVMIDYVNSRAHVYGSMDDYQGYAVFVVPEPASFGLLLLGVLAGAGGGDYTTSRLLEPENKNGFHIISPQS